MKKSLMIKNALRQVRHSFNRPFMVMFETTLHCNMKCGYCAIWQNQQPEDRAVRERVFALMDEAARLWRCCLEYFRRRTPDESKRAGLHRVRGAQRVLYIDANQRPCAQKICRVVSPVRSTGGID